MMALLVGIYRSLPHKVMVQIIMSRLVSLVALIITYSRTQAKRVDTLGCFKPEITFITLTGGGKTH